MFSGFTEYSICSNFECKSASLLSVSSCCDRSNFQRAAQRASSAPCPRAIVIRLHLTELIVEPIHLVGERVDRPLHLLQRRPGLAFLRVLEVARLALLRQSRRPC